MQIGPTPDIVRGGPRSAKRCRMNSSASGAVKKASTSALSRASPALSVEGTAPAPDIAGLPELRRAGYLLPSVDSELDLTGVFIKVSTKAGQFQECSIENSAD